MKSTIYKLNMNVKPLGLIALGLLLCFNTLAQTIVAESFDQVGPYPSLNLPFGWTQGKVVGSDPDNYFDRIAVSTNPATGTNSGAAMIRFNSFLTPAGEASILVSKPFDLSARGVAVSSNLRFFLYRDAGFPAALDNIQVYVNTVPNLTGTPTLLADTAGSSLTTINRYYLASPAVAAVGWYKYGFTIPAGAAYNVSNLYVIIRANSQFGNDILIDDFSIHTYPSNQVLTSSAVVQQNVSNVGIGTNNQWIIGVNIVATGAAAVFTVDTMEFTTAGTTNTAVDITNARLWYTGGTPTLNTGFAQLLGTIASPGVNINYRVPAGTMPAGFTLDNGNNYFWITYDITAGATSGNYADAEFAQFRYKRAAPSVNSLTVPGVTTLAGSRMIDLAYCIPTYIFGTSWSNYGTGGEGNDYIASVQLIGESGYPIINNNLNTNGPWAGAAFSAHPPDYERFPPVANKTTVLKADGLTSYTLTATVGTYAFGNCLAAWIDFNHDGDFYDAGEKILQTVYPPGNGNNVPTAASFTVPTTAFLGNTTLRVREVWINGAIDPCATYNYGETEDYTITIIPDCGTIVPTLAGWRIWLGGFSDDWNVIQNWCGGVPTSVTDAAIVDSASTLGKIKPTYYPVIKSSIVAATKRLRIEGNASLTINAPLGSSLTMNDSITIKNAASRMTVKTQYADTIQINNGNLINTNCYPFNGTKVKQRMQLLYTQAELLSYGLVAGDIIDTLIFHILSRSSTQPYSNFNISYYYTNIAQFGTGAAALIATVAGLPAAPVNIFSGSVNLTGLPATGGTIKIPLTPNTLIWAGDTRKLVIDICWDNATSSNLDQTYVTQTTGWRYFMIYARTVIGNMTTNACALTNATTDTLNANGGTRFAGEYRPNITFKFHRSYIKYPINLVGPSADWINNGVFTAGWSRVTMNGNTNIQRIRGTSATTFNDLVINNTAHVRQENSVTVDSFMVLTNGRYILNQNLLTENYADASAISRTNGYLFSEDVPPNYGRVRWRMNNSTQTFVFPFFTTNSGGTYIPFTYVPTGGTNDLVVATYPTNAANVPYPTGVANINNYYTGTPNGANMVDRFWIITNGGASPTGNMTFAFAPVESPGAGFLSSQRHDALTGWQPYTAGQTNPSGTSNYSPGLSQFNTPWALTLQPQPLPVELLRFTAVPDGKRVRLEWVTASEQNSKNFTIDRTQDFNEYRFIDQVDSKGNSTTTQQYKTYDNAPLAGLQYYRLRQTDFSGQFRDYGPVAVNFGKAFEIITIVPDDNYSSTVVFNYDSDEPFTYRVIDGTGRIVAMEQNLKAEVGINNLEVRAALAPGIYTLVIQNSKQLQSRKFIR